MDKSSLELMPNTEERFEILSESLKDLVEEYNNDESHRQIRPHKYFGELSGGMRLFWFYWDDDQESTHTVGFVYKQKTNTLTSAGIKNIISFDNAIEYFSRQLKDIPKKNFSDFAWE